MFTAFYDVRDIIPILNNIQSFFCFQTLFDSCTMLFEYTMLKLEGSEISILLYPSTAKLYDDFKQIKIRFDLSFSQTTNINSRLLWH